MSPIIIQRRVAGAVSGYLVPASGEILWWSVASTIPEGWQIDTNTKNQFVEGSSAASDTSEGSLSHSHVNPNTSSRSNHSHSVGSGTSGSGGGSHEHFGTSNQVSGNPNHTHSIGSGISSSAGGHSHSTGDTGTSQSLPPYRRLYWITATVDNGVPIGGIIIWDDVIENAPEGFHLCDGGEYDGLVTPDLRELCIYGASSDEDVGVEGGAIEHHHTNPNTGLAGGHSHTHSGTTGGHSGSTNASGYDSGTTVGGPHSHSFYGTTSTDSNHSHTISNTGVATSLPPVIHLYYLVRTL